MGETVIEVESVSKRFRVQDVHRRTLKDRLIRMGGHAGGQEFWALNDVSLTVGGGETLGLIGHNGSGKSTLLKCIGGILQPTKGQIVTRGRLASLLELGAGFHHDLTGRENVYLNGSILGLSRRDLDARFDDIVGFAELEQFIDQPVKTYSSGMFVRLGFAVAVNVEPDILLVDEVLAVGDEAFQARCLDRIREFQREGRTIVFVTHGVDLVRQICDRAAVLNAGKLVALGEPAEAVRRFRDTLLNRSAWYSDLEPHADQPALVDAASALPDRIVRVEAVRLVQGGLDVADVHPRQPLVVEVDYDATAPVDDFVCSLHLFDKGGRVLYGTNTDFIGLDLGVVSGPGRLRFGIGSVNLLAGVYTLSLGLHSTDSSRVYDFFETRFDVAKDGSHEAGVVVLDVTGEHERL